MKLTVKDLFNIPVLSNFKLVAGEGGLNNPIEVTEILDFEFIQGVDLSRDSVFDGKSLALSSLLFAKDNPSLIVDAVKKLHALNVSCLAYKTVLVKKIPQEAIDFANAHNFPLLEFGGDEFFESIILSVNQELDAGRDIAALEREFSRMISQETTAKEESKLCKKINIGFKKYIRAVSIRDNDHLSDEQIIALVKKMQSFEKINKKASLCKYKDSYFVILSQDEPDKSRFTALLEDILLGLQIDRNSAFCGISSIRSTSDGFGRAVREAFWARNVASIENTKTRFYDEIGIYRLVAPSINSPIVKTYMAEYLAPLLHNNDDLLKTARVYILCRGDLDKTAETLFCHKNTIRYRLSKIHELLDPKSNEKEFNENLSIAIRIYLLHQFL